MIFVLKNAIIVYILPFGDVFVMILSSTTAVIDDKFGMKKAIEILANAGFDAVDISLRSMNLDGNEFCSDNYREYAKELFEFAKEKGVFFNQAHSCYPSSYIDDGKTETAFQNIVKGIEIASIVGAKIIVVHPKQHLYYCMGDNDKKLKQMNLDFYKRLMPYCEKYGVKIATENMWQDGRINKVIVQSTCAKSTEFCEYVDMIDNDYMTACLDIGHCGLVGQQPEEMIRSLGHNRLGALHVHDNDGRRDCHVEPMSSFLSTVNWDEVCKALAEINYQGDFTFEAERMFLNSNIDTVNATASLLHDIGRYLIGRIEYFKQNH